MPAVQAMARRFSLASDRLSLGLTGNYEVAGPASAGQSFSLTINYRKANCLATGAVKGSISLAADRVAEFGDQSDLRAEHPYSTPDTP
jgi:hypothetical protein